MLPRLLLLHSTCGEANASVLFLRERFMQASRVLRLSEKILCSIIICAYAYNYCRYFNCALALGACIVLYHRRVHTHSSYCGRYNDFDTAHTGGKSSRLT